MLIKLATTVALLFLFFLAPATVVCQTPGNGGWSRVQSDDGEFSAEVPARYRFFYDERGFSSGHAGHDLPLAKMEMINAVSNGTLVSVERYFASKIAVEALFDSDRERRSSVVKSLENTNASRPNGAKYRQLIAKADKYYSIRQYFYTKDHIYILTAASRDGETAEIRRFLDSIKVQLAPPPSVPPDATVFSKLQHSGIVVKDLTGQPAAPKTPKPKGAPTETKIPDPNDKPLIIVEKPLPGYTETARAAGVSGGILVRLEFADDGSIPKVSFLRALPSGLSRQALFALLRIKFLPQETNGVPRSVTKSIEYTFSIY